ncbi:hypothetical protein VQ056_23550 [Paenibacillus sp. JTLBN-2024]
MDMEQKDEGLIRLMKSPHLYLYADLHGADHTMLKLPERVAELKEGIKGYRIPAKTDQLLLRYEEERGRYDEAENASTGCSISRKSPKRKALPSIKDC